MRGDEFRIQDSGFRIQNGEKYTGKPLHVGDIINIVRTLMQTQPRLAG